MTKQNKIEYSDFQEEREEKKKTKERKKNEDKQTCTMELRHSDPKF